MKHFIHYIFIALFSFAIAACGGSSDPLPSTPNTGNDGSNTGGDNTGGDNTGGDNTGGDNTGGDNTGGDNTGGDNTGGDNTGGDNTGGDNTGGDNTGGDNTGGDNTGGDNTGGDNTSGDNTGGGNTGGDNTGGDNTGGDNTGGDNTGGDNTGADLVPLTIHMIGDSTITEYSADRRPQAGWGEQVAMFVSDKATVTNWARGGRSSRSFYYEEGRWNSVKSTITSGDYLIIQFGHNDQKYGGDYDEFGTYAYCSDGTNNGEGCADVEHSYYQFLKKYVEEARALGATPVLMTPIVRKYFSGGTITNKGQHNLESAYTGETYARGNYAQAMRDVAATYNVPLVDLTVETKGIVETYGDVAATDSLYISADSTHPQVLFATLIAKQAMEGLKAQQVLADYVVSATSLIASPDAVDWGNRYVGVTNVKALTLSAFDLTPTDSAITVTAPDGFMLGDSEDTTNWQNSYALDYTNGAFTQKLYVQFNPSSEQEFSGVIDFSLEGQSLGMVEVKGTGVAVGEGVDSYSSWFTAGSDLAAVTDGLVNATDVNVAGLEAGSAKTLAVDGQDTSVARYKVFGPDLVARNESQYLEFKVKSATQNFYVDTISAWLTTSGGSTVQADIEYSLSSDFSNAVKLNADPLSFTKDTMTAFNYGVTLKVPEGESVYVRIYPWNAAGENSSGKYLALYGVEISGISGQ